jgi:hypothetical protein
MDVGRSTSSLGKMGILCFIQELAMTRMSDHVSLTGGITNSSVEIASGSIGAMDLLKLLEGAWGEDVDLNMPHKFKAFIHYLHPVILQLLLVSQFLQHLP